MYNVVVLVPSELCAEALTLLRLKGRDAFGEVERLIGWESPIGMLNRVMAQRLGITEYQLKYLLRRHDLREKEKEEERRTTGSHAAHVAFATHTCHKLGSSIALPVNCRVIMDTLEPTRLAQEYLDLGPEPG